MTGRAQHWQAVYAGKAEGQTSWFRPHLDESLRLIDALVDDRQAPAIDVGAGRSTLVDDLLTRGFADVTALDVSSEALSQSRARLADEAARVRWLNADILEVELPDAGYGLWHDRAVFHFLTSPEQVARYVARASRAIRPGGVLLLATFAADGPERCSGLPVNRYDPAALARLFAGDFELVSTSRELHRTPAASRQAFTYVALRRRSRPGPFPE
jgi:SAM-dependent methyltransferase